MVTDPWLPVSKTHWLPRGFQQVQEAAGRCGDWGKTWSQHGVCLGSHALPSLAACLAATAAVLHVSTEPWRF